MTRLPKASLAAVLVLTLGACSQTTTPLNDPDFEQAVNGAEAPKPGQALAVLKPDGLPPPASHKHALEFRRRAEKNGSVRVIVRLRSSFELDGKLKLPSAIQTQRAEIGIAQRALLRRLEGREIHVNRQYDTMPLLALNVDARGIDELLQNENVLSIEEDAQLHTSLNTSVPRINGDDVWTLGYTGSGQVVAVLDTGVEKTHSMLTGKVVSEACYSSNSGIYSTFCPDGTTASTATGSGVNCSTSISECGHGTHVAGIAAGNGTFVGVSKSSNIVAIQVFTKVTDTTTCSASNTTSPCTTAFFSDVISGLQRVLTLYQSGTAIASVNMSIGGGQYTSTCDSSNSSMKTAIDNLRSVNIATIVASGNNGYTNALSTPACVSTAISVGATLKTADTVDTSYSNSASFLNLLAPGTTIYSSWPTNSYASATGTSMAAPHVAGAWALLKSAKSDLTVTEGLAAFQNTGVSVTDSRNSITKPRIDVLAALNTLSPTAATFSPPAGTYPASKTVTVTAGATTGTSMKYTTDGSTPSSTAGTAISTGGTVSITNSAASKTLKVATYKTGLTDAITSAVYGFTGTYTVSISPQAAIDAGAKWRLDKGYENFEDGALTRFTWTSSGTGTWAVDTSTAYEGLYSVKSPTITHSQTTSLSSTIETSGGTLTFWYKTSTEATNDKLTFYVDGVSQGTYSGTTGWTQASFTLAAGSRVLTWTYSKNASTSSGSDAVWIDNITFPGDEWRSSGTTEKGVTTGNTSIYWNTLTDYVSPSTVSNSTSGVPSITQTGTYVRKTGTVSTTVSPTAAVTAGAQWRIDGGSWLNSGASASSINTGTHTIDFSTVTGWTTPSSQSITVSYNTTTPVTATYVQLQVATPTFSVPGNTYTTAQSITLATTGGATIRYTTDGSPPTSSSTVYSSAISVPLNTTTTIKAYATLSGYLDSSVASATYVVTGTVATPTFSVPANTYTTAQSVTLASTTSGATIYYTTDGTTPTSASTLYASAIPVPLNTTMIIKAIATKSTWLDSSVASATYVVTGTVATPTFSVPANTYTTAQSVTLSTTTSGATIYYTTDGSTPTTSSLVYGSAITIPLNTTKTIKALATKASWTNSTIASATYVVTDTVVAPTFGVPANTYTTAQSVTLSTTTSGASIYYTTDGSTPTSSSTLYSGAISIPLNTTKTIKAIATRSTWADSSVASATYVVTGTVATPTFSVPANTYTTAQSITLSTATSGATIYYTTDGATPTSSSAVYATAIAIPLDTTMRIKAIALKSSWIDSSIATATYVVTGTVATPTISLASGTFTTQQTVTLATTTAGASLRYTIDGSTPASGSTLYTGPLTVPLDTTWALKVIAVKQDWADSTIASANYTVTGTVGTPTFSVAGGTYTTAQLLTISTSTAGATLRYTTDGSDPISTSTQYTGPITLPLDSSLNLKVRGFKATWTDSAVASASYLITGTVAAPAFSLTPGIYTTAQTVSLSTSTANAVIHYTLDGSDPTTSSPVYTSAFSLALDSATTLKARAFRTDWTTSGLASGTFTITGTVATPVLSLAGGLYTTAQTVTLTSATANAEIRYTIDGSTPDLSSPLYTGPLNLGLDSTVPLKVRAFRTDWVDSDEAFALYTITGTVATPEFSVSTGIYVTAQTVAINTNTVGADLRYTTDGTTPTPSSRLYTLPIDVPLDSALHLKVRAFRQDWVDSALASADITVTGTVATPTLSLPGHLYYTAQTVTVGCATTGADVRYTLDGTTPRLSSPQYTSALTFPLDSESVLSVRAFKPDWVDSDVVTANYKITGTIATPVANPVGGLYATDQAVALTTTTASTDIRYTLDGSPPEDDSPIYASPIDLPIPSHVTLRAKGFRNDWLPSAELTATYFVYASLVVTPHGSGASGDVVESGQTLSVDVTGGSGNYNVTAAPNAAGVSGTISAGAHGTYAFTAPSTGAFAGVHTVFIEDVTSGATQSVNVTVPPHITVSRSVLPAQLGTATVTVTGGAVGTTFELSVLDENGMIASGLLATITSKAMAVDDAAHGNPAVGTLFAGAAAVPTSISVHAQSGQLENISSTILIVPSTTYRGLVLDVSGRPVAGARVEATGLLDADGQQYFALTAADGTFVVAIPSTETVALAITAMGYQAGHPTTSECATEAGCQAVLAGETRFLRGTVIGLGTGDVAKLSLFYTKATGELVEVGPLPVQGTGNGPVPYELSIDGALTYVRLEAKSFGFDPFTSDNNGQGFVLIQGNIEGVVVTLVPTTPTVNGLQVENVGQTGAKLSATFDARERTTKASIELAKDAGEFEPIASNSLTASTTSQSVSATPSVLVCGTTYRARAVAVNDREKRSETPEITFTTAACGDSSNDANAKKVKSGCSSSGPMGNAAVGALMLCLLLRMIARRRAARV